jgi:hypothetical protein
MKEKYTEMMKFGDMPGGTHFTDSSSGGRKFIKIKTKVACGLHMVCESHVKMEDGTLSSRGNHNAIDYEGFTARCPDWVPFYVIGTKIV